MPTLLSSELQECPILSTLLSQHFHIIFIFFDILGPKSNSSLLNTKDVPKHNCQHAGTGYLVPGHVGLGSRQMARVLWTPPSPSPSLGGSGRHSGQETIIRGFPKVLGSWWEIFENGDRGSTQNFAADVVSVEVWLGEPFWKNKKTNQDMHIF